MTRKDPREKLHFLYWILWDKTAWELEGRRKVHVEITSYLKKNSLPCENYLEIVFS